MKLNHLIIFIKSIFSVYNYIVILFTSMNIGCSYSLAALYDNTHVYVMISVGVKLYSIHV